MHNPANYIMTNDNKLFFIDLGSFHRKRVTDETLFGYHLFKQINKDIFWDSYFDSGGTKYIYNNMQFLKLVQHIKKAAYHLKKFHKLPWLDLRKKRQRYIRYKWMLNEMISEIEIN